VREALEVNQTNCASFLQLFYCIFVSIVAHDIKFIVLGWPILTNKYDKTLFFDYFDGFLVRIARNLRPPLDAIKLGK